MFYLYSVSKSQIMRVVACIERVSVLRYCQVTADLISFEVEEFRIILRHEVGPGQRPAARPKVKLCS